MSVSIKIKKSLDNLKKSFSKKIGYQSIIKFEKINFWNSFCIFVFTCVIWLCFLAIIGVNSLQQITNPIKYISNNQVILEVYPESSSKRTKDKLQLIESLLSKNPSVESYSVIPENRLREIIDSYSSNSIENINNISLPIIISATLTNSSQETVQNLRIYLSKSVEKVYVDTEGELIQRLSDPLVSTEYIVLMIPLISIFVMIAIIFLVTYSMLFNNKKIIETALFLGAFRKSIVVEFGVWVLRKTFMASILSIALVVLTSLFLYYAFSFGSIPIGEHLLFILLLIILLPISSCAVSALFINKLIKDNYIKENS